MAMKSKRIHSKSKVPTLLNWKQTDEAIRRIGNLQLAINAAESKAKDAIDGAKLELAATATPLQKRIKELVTAVEVFASRDINKPDFRGAKSMKLGFGTLGWRASSSIKISVKKKLGKTLDLIKSVFTPAKAKPLIIVKESVDKNALAKLTDEDLAKVNARRDSKDVFFVEPDLPEAADYE